LTRVKYTATGMKEKKKELSYPLVYSLHANPLARSLGKVKLDSDK